jgi:hypothetical protein
MADVWRSVRRHGPTPTRRTRTTTGEHPPTHTESALPADFTLPTEIPD